MRRTALGVAVLLVAVAARAQTPASQSTTESPVNRAPTPERAEPDSYAYDPAGRRDPFLSLVGTGIEPRVGSSRAEGAAGLTIDEISVRGIVQSRGALIAMVQGPDNKTYVVHQGERFVDGSLKSITPQGLVFVQEIHDPLSLIKQREVRKLLRSAEGAKP